MCSRLTPTKLAKLLCPLLDGDQPLSLSEQQIVLSTLAHSGLFAPMGKFLLLVTAEELPNEDEVLLEKLRKHREWRLNAQHQAETGSGKRPGAGGGHLGVASRSEER